MVVDANCCWCWIGCPKGLSFFLSVPFFFFFNRYLFILSSLALLESEFVTRLSFSDNNFGVLGLGIFSSLTMKEETGVWMNKTFDEQHVAWHKCCPHRKQKICVWVFTVRQSPWDSCVFQRPFSVIDLFVNLVMTWLNDCTILSLITDYFQPLMASSNNKNWDWAQHVNPKCLTRDHVYQAYHIDRDGCSSDTCRRNCIQKPKCIYHLGM